MKDVKQRGQMLLVVVLVMIVALTVGLSVASRSITNLRISRQGAESQRAFQAAEAGVEQVLQSGGGNSSDPNISNSAGYTTKVSYPSGTSFALNGGELVDQDSGLDVWFSNYPDFSSQLGTVGTPAHVTIYWGTSNQLNCTNTGGATGPSQVKSALEIVILTGNKLSPTMNKYLVEANGCNRITGPLSVTGAGGTPAGQSLTFQNSFQINVAQGLIGRVVPIFNSTKMAITSDIAMTKQGTTVESVGSSGDTARKVDYFASFPQIPLEVFPYSLITQ